MFPVHLYDLDYTQNRVVQTKITSNINNTIYLLFTLSSGTNIDVTSCIRYLFCHQFCPLSLVQILFGPLYIFW